MLTQIQIQYRDERPSELVAQREVADRRKLAKWIFDVKKKHGNLADDQLWLVCHEGSPYFLYMAVEEETGG